MSAGARRVGAVDCGTNSIRLLVADVGADGGLVEIDRRMEIVRLGQGVDVSGRIAPEAMERTLVATRDYAARCRELEVEVVRFVATSASRDAENAEQFVAGVREAFGDLDVTPEVVSGDTEAALSFVGSTGGLRAAGLDGPYLVVDIGGGSTELVRGTTDVEAAVSVDIGSVRLTERHLHGDPPTADEVVAARADVASTLDLVEGRVDLTGLGTVVGLAGSITTVTAHALGLGRYDRAAIHLAGLPVGRHRTACRELWGMTREQRAGLPYMQPGRVDVIGAGAVIWHELLGRVAVRSPGVSAVTSEHDILDGIALSLA